MLKEHFLLVAPNATARVQIFHSLVKVRSIIRPCPGKPVQHFHLLHLLHGTWNVADRVTHIRYPNSVISNETYSLSLLARLLPRCRTHSPISQVAHQMPFRSVQDAGHICYSLHAYLQLSQSRSMIVNYK